MLEQVQDQHFQPLLGQTATLRLPDGSELPIHIDSLEQKPRSQMPNSERVPFGVGFNSLEPTDFVDGLCALELPGLGPVQDIFVSRVPAMGRDPAVGYFYIAFN
ncbi:hypothetical protein NYP20_00740 [Pseudomonas sp. N3-W]|uniref:DUF6916 domain-containing protein n=1 Tax=Pseudomonas fungipugnans TaxID=3024217 RepID=A0ABT6QQH9_9PSED|nr:MULTISPECIES: hypothetical protein [unclassified Pseudomonas]MDI2593074.1 hypothetical protein [Pseudomonas sp. 681]UWF49529.1 hypothetical protein NYP20_00740 [Pseudomonas sp. N3-W]